MSAPEPEDEPDSEDLSSASNGIESRVGDLPDAALGAGMFRVIAPPLLLATRAVVVLLVSVSPVAERADDDE